MERYTTNIRPDRSIRLDLSPSMMSMDYTPPYGIRRPGSNPHFGPREMLDMAGGSNPMSPRELASLVASYNLSPHTGQTNQDEDDMFMLGRQSRSGSVPGGLLELSGEGGRDFGPEIAGSGKIKESTYRVIPKGFQGDQTEAQRISEMMDTSGIDRTLAYSQMPEGGIGGGAAAGLSDIQGYSMPFPEELRQQILTDPEFAGTSIPFDDPSIAGERITDHPKFNNVAGLLGPPSPEQLRAMQEQTGGPGFWDAPRFAAADQAQMGTGITKSDRSDPNFYAPEFSRSEKPGGLLSPELTAQPGSPAEGGKWENDRRFPGKYDKLAELMFTHGMDIFNEDPNQVFGR